MLISGSNFRITITRVSPICNLIYISLEDLDIGAMTNRVWSCMVCSSFLFSRCFQHFLQNSNPNFVNCRNDNAMQHKRIFWIKIITFFYVYCIYYAVNAYNLQKMECDFISTYKLISQMCIFLSIAMVLKPRKKRTSTHTSSHNALRLCQYLSPPQYVW